MSLADDIKISQIQQCFRAAGFQWQEHIFNDDKNKYGNCMIELTQNKSPQAFNSFPRPSDTVGWGRFNRIQCWEMAYDWLLLKDLGVECDLNKNREDDLHNKCLSKNFPNHQESHYGKVDYR